MEILREQFKGLIIFSFSFTLSTFLSNIEALIFLDTNIKKRAPQIWLYEEHFQEHLRLKYLRTLSLGPKIRCSYKKGVYLIKNNSHTEVRGHLSIKRIGVSQWPADGQDLQFQITKWTAVKLFPIIFEINEYLSIESPLCFLRITKRYNMV